MDLPKASAYKALKKATAFLLWPGEALASLKNRDSEVESLNRCEGCGLVIAVALNDDRGYFVFEIYRMFLYPR